MRSGRSGRRRLPQIRSDASQSTTRAWRTASSYRVGREVLRGFRPRLALKYPHGVLPVVSGHPDELIEDLRLVAFARCPVALRHRAHELRPGLSTDVAIASLLCPFGSKTREATAPLR